MPGKSVARRGGRNELLRQDHVCALPRWSSWYAMHRVGLIVLGTRVDASDGFRTAGAARDQGVPLGDRRKLFERPGHYLEAIDRYHMARLLVRQSLIAGGSPDVATGRFQGALVRRKPRNHSACAFRHRHAAVARGADLQAEAARIPEAIRSAGVPTLEDDSTASASGSQTFASKSGARLHLSVCPDGKTIGKVECWKKELSRCPIPTAGALLA